MFNEYILPTFNPNQKKRSVYKDVRITNANNKRGDWRKLNIWLKNIQIQVQTTGQRSVEWEKKLFEWNVFKYKQRKCMKFFTTGSKCITMHHPPVKLPNLKWEFKRALKTQTQIQEQKIKITNIRLKSCMKFIAVHNMKPLKVAAR